MPRIARSNESVTPRKSATQERSRATVEAILIASAQVLERDGYSATKTEAVAERAGVSVGTLYQYFPNKDALLLALAYCHLVESAQSLMPELNRLRQEPAPAAAEVIPRLVRVAVSLHDGNAALHRLLNDETPIPPELREPAERANDAFVDLLAGYLQRAPDTQLTRPQLAARLLVHGLTDTVHRFVIRPPAGATIEDCERELTAQLMRYLRGSEPPD